jgi:thioredoxin-like negative regulator of GroEL
MPGLTKFQKKAAIATAILLLVALFGTWMYSHRTEMFSSPVVVEFYYMNGCGWCEKFMPEWEKYQAQATAAGIQCKKIEAQDAGDNLTKYNIHGFPTVIIIRDGQATEYDGERTADALMKATDISATVGPGESLGKVPARTQDLYAN